MTQQPTMICVHSMWPPMKAKLFKLPFEDTKWVILSFSTLKFIDSLMNIPVPEEKVVNLM